MGDTRKVEEGGEVEKDLLGARGEVRGGSKYREGLWELVRGKFRMFV